MKGNRTPKSPPPAFSLHRHLSCFASRSRASRRAFPAILLRQEEWLCLRSSRQKVERTWMTWPGSFGKAFPPRTHAPKRCFKPFGDMGKMACDESRTRMPKVQAKSGAELRQLPPPASCRQRDQRSAARFGQSHRGGPGTVARPRGRGINSRS